jgi:hypothetical protein
MIRVFLWLAAGAAIGYICLLVLVTHDLPHDALPLNRGEWLLLTASPSFPAPSWARCLAWPTPCCVK